MPHSHLPMADRKTEDVPGHWLLARLGKRVLRPGGLELTTWLLDHAQLTGKKAVEFAPGLGRTAALIVDKKPASYVGVDEDPQAAAATAKVVSGTGRTVNATAQDTGLDAASAEVIIGEAMLTMQGDKGKDAIVEEARRVLAPGGRYAVHELALTPDDVPDDQKLELRRALARAIKVNARPLTVAEWRDLFDRHGFEVEAVQTAPMALLEPKRNLADEGVLGVARILFNVARDKKARARVLEMRRVFNSNKDNLAGVALVAVKR